MRKVPTFFNWSCNPGARVTQATIIISSNMTVYMSREDVELVHDGQAEQHNEHAALVQQHAI